VSAAGWDHFKISPQSDSSSLVEAMRTLYSSNLSQEPSPDTEMAVDQLAVEEAPFTTVTNKKTKGKGKVPSCTNSSAPSQNVPTPAPVVLRASPLPAKTATAKPTPVKVATKPQMPKQVPKSFAQATCSGNSQSTPRFALAFVHPEYESLLRLHDMFFFFVQKFITRCSIAVHGKLSTTSSLYGPQKPDCPITSKRHYQYHRRNLT